jgi:hypothetical protein
MAGQWLAAPVHRDRTEEAGEKVPLQYHGQ